MLQQHVKERFSDIEYPKWKRVGELQKKDLIQENFDKKMLEIEYNETIIHQGVRIHQLRGRDADIDEVFYIPYESTLERFKAYPYGTHEKYITEADGFFDQGVIVNVPKNVSVEEPVFFRYDAGKGNGFIDQNLICVGEGANITVVFDYTSSGDEIGYHNGLIRVLAEANARVKIILLQTFAKGIDHIQNTVSVIGNYGHVEYVSFDLGANVIASDYSAHLVGEASESEVATAYIGNGHQRLDLGYNSTHYGRYSQSLIETKGALLDHARKVFRGNLKFERGSTKSSGEESEYVLLLDENVRSDALPALLCDEDDVSGEHAASAGQVDEDQLFYLMSRGFNLKEAKKLVIHGSFSPIIDRLGITSIQERVELELERRLLYA